MDLLSMLRRRTEQAEVYRIQSESTEISFEANRMKSAGTEETQGVALRALVNGRLGFTAAAGHVVEEELVENLLASAEFGDEVPIRFPASSAGEPVQVYDPKLAEVPIATLVDIGHEIVQRLLDVDQDAKIDVSIERGLYQAWLQNSAGADTYDRVSSLSVSVSVERVRGDDVLMTYDGTSGISLSEDYRQVIARLADKLELAKKAASLPSGRMPVLFSPKGAMVLMWPLVQAINGQNVQRGTSPLGNRQGELVFDRRLTLWDDPLLPGRPRSSSHDEEGVPCYRKAPIQEGVCTGFLYDLRTATLMGTESTGNGSRSLFSPPSPAPSNLVVQAGETPLQEVIAGIEQGLLVEDVLGLGQGNPLSGVFSNTLGLAFVISHGEIVGRVKDLSIAG
ncbi:MAG: TldD/PmbA family protein, partial [Chloroflexi bacterium]|nr:TldD/PmbA family protein [Chloroflexota bacterium]